MGLGRGGEGGDLDVQLLLEVAVLWVCRVPQLLLLLFVPHRASPENGHLSHRVLLQLLQRAPPGTQQLAHKVELERKKFS